MILQRKIRPHSRGKTKVQRTVISTALSLLILTGLTMPPAPAICSTEMPPADIAALRAPLKALKTRARMGDERAQLRLAKMYYNGRELKKDYNEAYAWFKKASLQGVAEAQYNLARMYLQGQSVPRNYILSYMWFNLSSAGGYVRSIPELDSLEAKMTPRQITKAQKLSREFKVK